MVSWPPARRFLRDQCGAALTEALVVMSVILLMLTAFVELTATLFQWNLTVKALEVGVRLARVSSPVDSNLLSFSGMEGGADPGDPSPTYQSVCQNGTCNATYSGASLAGAYDANAMNRLLTGSDGSCAPVGQAIGMCDVYPRLLNELANIEVSYTFGGLGYAGRPGGPVPVVTITLRGMTFDFLLLDAFIGQDSLTMPDLTVTAIGEDLRTPFPGP